MSSFRLLNLSKKKYLRTKFTILRFVYFAFISSFVLSPHTSNAQKRYLFRNYTVNDGLSNNTIFSINQDNRGYLWIASDGGICSFDGSHFDNSVIPQVNSTQAFCQFVDKSPSGKLAMATFMQGVIVTDGNGKLKQYLRRKKQLGKNVIRTLKWVSNSKIITSESRNINMIDGDSIYQIYDCGVNQNMFQTLEYDNRKNIWFGGIDGLGIIFPNEKKKTPYFLPELKDVFIIKLLFINSTKLLAGTYNGLYEINIISSTKNNLHYTVSQPISELKGIKINHLYNDRQNNVWVSCVSDGIFEIYNNKIIRHITMENGLPTNAIMCAFQDNENNYWFGTSSGLCRLYSLTDFSYTYNNKQLAGIASFGIDKFKQLWLNDESNIYHIDNEKIISTPITKTFFKGQTLKSMDFTKNNAYFLTENAIYTAVQSKNETLNKVKKYIDLKKNSIDNLKCYFFDNDNLLWLGYVDGLFTWNGTKLQKTKIISDKELNLRPNDILKDKFGYYWVGDYMFGLYRFKYKGKDNENNIILRNELTYQSLKPDSAFATAWIQDVVLDHNQNMWISSLYTGVYKLTLDRSGVKKAVLYSTKNGLSSNDVTQIVEGKDNSMWFATRNGADRLVKGKNGKEKIIHYNEKNGFGRYVFQILPQDSITYINYEEGFFAVDNQLDKYGASIPLKVVISNIYVMGKPDTSATASHDKVYKIPFSHNFIAFDFGAVRLKDNEGIDYQYKLEGIDENWSDYSPRRYVSYNSLPPGKYTFKVRAKIVNNDTEEPITKYTFKIIPPFYRNIWFILLMMALSAVIGYFIYISRIRNLIKLEKLRTKIASDLHDDVGSTLSSISIMSDLLQTQIDSSHKAEDMIQKIGSNAHNMLESMDDIIWSVNPSNDKFQNLDLRMREYAIPLFESKDIQFQIITPQELSEISLPMDVRRNIFLIAKESVNNLIKYSNCTQAKVEFYLSRSLLKMEIFDNGNGFDTEQTSNRNGLRNMKQRAEQIQGDFSISSERGKGTKISLVVKIM